VRQQFYDRAGYPGMYTTLRHVRCLFYKSILCFSCYFIVIIQNISCAHFSGVIGAIDGCHIDVLAPANDQDSYTDRKMNHSIILQGGFLSRNRLSADSEIEAILNE